MAECYLQWDGDDWQNHVNALLGLRYSPGEYQPIPDRAGGDYGLEGFTNDGTAFQAYAAEEPLDVETLTQKQRDKITRDIKKLCDNHAQLQPILGSIRIKTWVLMVPRYDSKHILAHAEKKAAEVRAKNIGIVTDDFRISVQDDNLFAPQKAALMSGAYAKLPLTIPEVATTEVTVWTAAHNDLIATLEEKLRKLHKPPGVHEKLKARMVKHFLEGENAMQFLHANYPQVEEHVWRCKDAKERVLQTESMLSSAIPEIRLRETLAEFRERLSSEVAGVTRSTAEILAHGAAADWLLRCPLDFNEPV